VTVLAVVLALVGREIFTWLDRAPTFSTYQHWVQVLQSRFGSWPWNGPLGVALVLLLPAVLCALVHGLLVRRFPPLAVLFDAFVLLFCFGPGSLAQDLNRLVEPLSRGDEQGARQAAQLLRGGLPAWSGDPLRESLLRIPAQGNVRVLGVLLWFALLAPMAGPFGAVLYRLSERLFELLEGRDREALDFWGATARVFALLNWLPARVTAFSFALLGRYQGVRKQLKAKRELWYRVGLQTDVDLMTAAGEGALGELPSGSALDAKAFQERVDDALGLLTRTMWLWVGLMAAMTLSHWLA
jgi:adenosylcobinamide-phosphate synthase